MLISIYYLYFYSICCHCSVAQLCSTLCNLMDCSMRGFPILHHLSEVAQLTSTELVMPTISFSVITFSSCLQSFPASGSFPMSQLFASSGLILELQHQSFQWISRLISFRTDCFDLHEVQGTFKSLPQHHSWKASILRCSAFFMVQLIHPYMTTGKTITLTRQTCVSKEMSLLFSMLSRFVMAFLPRSKRLLISWLQSPSAVILESKKIKSLTVSIVSHLFAMKWWDQMPWSLFFECWVLSQFFHSPLSPSSRGSLVPLCFLP